MQSQLPEFLQNIVTKSGLSAAPTHSQSEIVTMGNALMGAGSGIGLVKRAVSLLVVGSTFSQEKQIYGLLVESEVVNLKGVFGWDAILQDWADSSGYNTPENATKVAFIWAGDQVDISQKMFSGSLGWCLHKTLTNIVLDEMAQREASAQKKAITAELDLTGKSAPGPRTL